MPHETGTGRVLLVGAGPGAADLLTVRALRAIETAEALLYDALVSDEVLALAPKACLKIQTGKRAGRGSMRQETINRLMLRLALRGLRVVRLKGGDPSIFGRAGEETEFLRGHGIEPEIVPGVTAACAAAAEFGFPLTHRGVARRVVFATARLEGGAAQTDWAAAADPETTVVLYMAGSNAHQVARTLMAAGRSPDTPVAIVSDLSLPQSSRQLASLADLQRRPLASDGPLLLVVGAVVESTVGQAARIWNCRRRPSAEVRA